MFIELLDTLRCVRTHEDSWLVGSFDELVDRHVIRGTLGCPVCSAEYPIRGGVVDFRGSGSAGADEPQSGASAESVVQTMPDEAAAWRLAALLDLSEPGGIVVLMGRWAAAAPSLESVATGGQFLLVNPTVPVFPFASAVRTETVLPLASGAARGVAHDPGGPPGVSTTEAARVLRAGGRLVAGGAEPVPDQVAEIARDASEWVGERRAEAAGPVLRLTRRK